MFEKHIPDDRGQVGIGTLIIFIALVLVAAVAAGVLVNTAGDLQSRAADTGADAQAQVSNQIDVVSATGVALNSTAGVERVELVVKKSAGSDAIDLSEATIQYRSESDALTLTHGTAAEGNGGAREFLTEAVVDTDSDDVLTNSDERIRLLINTSKIEGTASDTVELGSGDSVDLEIVDQSGASTTYGVNIPDVLSGDYARV